MADNQSEANPLFFHGIIMFLLAAVVLTFGVIGIVRVAKAPSDTGEQAAAAPPASAGSRTDASSAIRNAESKQRQVAMDAQRLKTKPTSLSDVAYKLDSAKRLAGGAGAALKKVVTYGVPIFMILMAGVMVFVGIKLLKQANWARHVGFALVALTLLYYTYGVAASLAATAVDETGAPILDDAGTPLLVEFSVWKPIVLIVIAAIAGKYLWDLNQEKFAPAAEPA